jgi:transketolase
MRKDFSKLLHDEMAVEPDLVLITGDLGYGLWDKIKIDYPSRFYNVGSSEQLMMGLATGMAMEGKIPIVYSITPFLLYRPFELIRNYLDHEKIPVKLVGGGRDKDYGYLGFSHWAEDDRKIMSVFSNIDTYHPVNIDEMEMIFSSFIYKKRPGYLNLER